MLENNSLKRRKKRKVIRDIEELDADYDYDNMELGEHYTAKPKQNQFQHYGNQFNLSDLME